MFASLALLTRTRATHTSPTAHSSQLIKIATRAPLMRATRRDAPREQRTRINQCARVAIGGRRAHKHNPAAGSTHGSTGGKLVTRTPVRCAQQVGVAREYATTRVARTQRALKHTGGSAVGTMPQRVGAMSTALADQTQLRVEPPPSMCELRPYAPTAHEASLASTHRHIHRTPPPTRRPSNLSSAAWHTLTVVT